MSGEFDIKQITGHQFMDDDEKEFFEKYGDALCDQVELIADQHDIDPKTMENEFAYLSDSFQYRKSEYIVENAVLTCSMRTEDKQILNDEGEKIESIPNMNEDMSKIMIPEDRKETINGLIPVNVTDTNGGLRDESKGLNIVSFGNCQWIKDDTLIEDMAKILHESLKNQDRKETVLEIKEKMKKAIQEGKGTCYCSMRLNPEWENMPSGYNFAEETFRDNFPSVGINKVLMSPSYFQFNGREGINMTSMLFCNCGGIISATMSGQNTVTSEDIWNDYELALLEKFYDQLAYENWSDEKKIGAEAFWKMLYENGEVDSIFTMGLIGNMYGEGAAGMLQGDLPWSRYGLNLPKYGIISNIEQAEIACATPDGWGLGMLQWSNVIRKEILFSNYDEFKSDDGTLTQEQLILAECKTILDELNLGEKEQNKFDDCKRIYPEYLQSVENIDKIGDKITFAVCTIFRKYEIPATSKDVDFESLTVREEVWDKALSAESFDDVPSICKRIIGAKIAYEELGE